MDEEIMQQVMKPKGLAKLWREIKRPFGRKFVKTLGVARRSLVKKNASNNYLACCCVEQTSRKI
jgi:hypothetical protein